MRICFLDGNFPEKDGSGGGGAGWYIKTIGKQHIRDGHTVLILKSVPNGSKKSYVDRNGIEVVHFTLSSRFLTYLSKVLILNSLVRPLAFIANSWTAYKVLLSQNKKKKIDIVESVDGGNIWLSIINKFTFIEHLHCSRYTIKDQCSLPTSISEAYERKLQLMTIKSANAVTSPSKAMLKIVEKEMNCELENKTFIPLCVENFKSKEKKNDKRIKLIFASRNDALKGGDLLLKAIKEVNVKHIDKTKYFFVGFEPVSTSVYPSNIIFKNFIRRKNLLKLYEDCDIALLPSFFDNSPMFLYESMAAGMPVIATNIGGIPELVNHGNSGFLFEKHNYKQLSKFIIELVENHDKRIWMGKNAQNFIREYASIQKIAEKKINLYEKAIERSNRKL